MSDLIAKAQLSDSKDCPAFSAKPVLQKIATRTALLGEQLTIKRVLPHRERRMIGAWCFLDQFGPLNLKESNGLKVTPHPHIGLQTFTWTLQGEILHRDSLGSLQVIQPGQVNLMTAGNGISHSEESLPDGVLHGLQLWIALPDSVRHMEPNFIHYPQVPNLSHEGLSIDVMVGELLGLKAPTKVYSPLIGLHLQAKEQTTATLPLQTQFEYGLLPLTDSIKVEGEPIDPNTMLYLGCGRTQLSLQLPQKARVLLIGGEPFKEELLIWWNFVARTKQEIKDAIRSWNDRTHFGEVMGYPGERSLAPEMP